jgi:hypothetical protein
MPIQAGRLPPITPHENPESLAGSGNGIPACAVKPTKAAEAAKTNLMAVFFMCTTLPLYNLPDMGTYRLLFITSTLAYTACLMGLPNHFEVDTCAKKKGLHLATQHEKTSQVIVKAGGVKY